MPHFHPSYMPCMVGSYCVISISFLFDLCLSHCIMRCRRHLTVATSWGLRRVQKHNTIKNMIYSPGVPKNTFFSKHVVINAHRTNILENKIFGPSTYPHVQFSKKSITKNCAISRKNNDFFSCHERNFSANILKFLELYFLFL